MRQNLATLVDDFRRHGSGIAIVTYRGNRRTASTWSELASLADRFAAELMRRGIAPGDRVVIWGQNSVEWVSAFFGCVLRGVICVPLDAVGSLDFARRVIAETTPRLIVGDQALLAQLASPEPQASTDLAQLAFDLFISELPPAAGPIAPDASIGLDTPLQILFTSGTTAEPKGIVHTHRNVLASVAPIEREIPKYLKYERLVHPLRFLHTLPLSHVFGQFMALWIPPLLGAEVHFESRLQAQRLVETARREKISVLACVPRVLDLLRDLLLAEHPELPSAIAAAQGEKAWKHWWRFRRIHRSFGFKFWAFVCGGASLSAELESFWNTLGFALIQGYGMTETAALITLNHPFKTGRGAIGKVLPGREVQIGEDGEIRVRGDMVSNATWQNGHMQHSDSPWLATGDLVRCDEEGQLYFLGRKSQVIVTPSGLNVHPEDVEAALNAQSGVEASAVVPLQVAGGTEPVAVLLFRGSRDQAQQAIVAANAQLADFQRIRKWWSWPELDLPRTSIGKIQRRKVTEWVNAQHQPAGQNETGPNADHSDPLLALILSITGARPEKNDDSTRLEEDLQLDSLGRVQLQAALEETLGLTLSDAMLEQTATLGDLRRALRLDPTAAATAPVSTAPGSTASDSAAAEPAPILAALATPPVPPPAAGDAIYPRWTWSLPIEALRVAFLEVILRPLVRLLAAPIVTRESTLAPAQPLLLIANHVSTYDVPLILYALPGPMRRHLAAAMAADILHDWRSRRNLGSWPLNQLGPVTYLLVSALFNVFPLPRGAGFRQSFQHAGAALDRGYNVLVFPEGHRSDTGDLQPFRSGIGLLVAESKTAVLPIALAGLAGMKAGRQRWFRSGKLRVIVGSPLSFPSGAPPEEITARLHAEIARLLSRP